LSISAYVIFAMIRPPTRVIGSLFASIPAFSPRHDG
jgi:hypothetical protein